MKLFDKRPLALILCITVGGFVIFSFSSEIIRLILLISAAALGLFTLLFLRGRPSRVSLSSTAVALLISMLLSDAYFNHYFKLTDDFTGEVEIEAVVYDVEYRDYTATLLFETRKIDGENMKRRLVGYINKSETNAIGVGSVVVFTSTLRDFNTDTSSYYYSHGFSASVGEIEAVSARRS